MKRGFFVPAGLFLVLGLAPSLLAAQEAKPGAVPHDLEGKAQCLMCHTGAMQGVAGVPADHEGRGNDTCLWCHAADSPMVTGAAPAIPHDMAGKEQCLMCHGGAMQGMPAAPASHEGRGNDTCTWCHKAGG